MDKQAEKPLTLAETIDELNFINDSFIVLSVAISPDNEIVIDYNLACSQLTTIQHFLSKTIEKLSYRNKMERGKENAKSEL